MGIQHRNILTVDGEQVAILGKVGVINKYQLSQYKDQFAKELDIAYKGVGCVFQKPNYGELKIWQPK
jgi:hypothetical protein